MRLSNVLPLKSGRGLDPRLSLYVWDNLKLGEGQTYKFEVRIPQIRLSKGTSYNGHQNLRHGNPTEDEESGEIAEEDFGDASSNVVPVRPMGPLKVYKCSIR